MDMDMQEREVAEILMHDDSLFKELDVQGALAAQEPLIEALPDTTEHLTLSQLRDRRLQRLAYLEDIYSSELWALADEMLLQRWVANLENSEPQQNLESILAGCSSSFDFDDVSINDLLTMIVEGGVKAAWLTTSKGNKDGQSMTTDPHFIENLSEFVTIILPLADNREQVETFQQRVVKRREAFIKKLAVLRRLEQSATAALARELDDMHAVAAFCSKKTRYLIRKTAVSVGVINNNSTTANRQEIDVDLSEEGLASAGLPSRQLAHVFINADGDWNIRVVGRHKVSLNGTVLDNEKTVPLPHMSLLGIGLLSLLFVVNTNASRRIAKSSDLIHV